MKDMLPVVGLVGQGISESHQMEGGQASEQQGQGSLVDLCISPCPLGQQEEREEEVPLCRLGDFLLRTFISTGVLKAYS